MTTQFNPELVRSMRLPVPTLMPLRPVHRPSPSRQPRSENRHRARLVEAAALQRAAVRAVLLLLILAALAVASVCRHAHEWRWDSRRHPSGRRTHHRQSCRERDSCHRHRRVEVRFGRVVQALSSVAAHRSSAQSPCRQAAIALHRLSGAVPQYCVQCC